MQDHLVIRQQLFECDQVFQSAYVGHTVSASGGKSVADDLVIPEIHIQGEFIIDAFHIEGGHVAHNALQRPIKLYFGQKQIGKYSVGIARLFVLVVLGFALDPGCFAAFMSIGIRENKPSVQADLGIQPAVSMRRILKVVFLKQQDIADEGSCPFRRVRETLFPAVKAAALDAHGFTEQFYRELSRQLHDYLVFLLPYRTTVPSPFTSYPFFSLASVIRALMSS